MSVVMFANYAIAAFLISVVQSRAVNISNTWMLPEEGFPVFYRYFRDRISWYEADAVCQFHHANLVTADSSSQYDAIRAYLKELDITEKVWIGLSKPQEKSKFQWTNFQVLSDEGHWQESIPVGDTQSLCAVMDPTADFLWRPLPCGGPEVAAFICELPIPSWAVGPKGCLLTELPSLTVLFIPEQSALELTSDCGLDGTKRIACKGSADREEMLRQLTCLISHDDIDEDKSTTSKTSTSVLSDYLFVETSTLLEDVDSISNETLKSLTPNTINSVSEDSLPATSARYRRETEDSLSPIVSTKSSFKETTLPDIAARHQKKVVLTTQHVVDNYVTPTSPTSFEGEKTTLTWSTGVTLMTSKKFAEISMPTTKSSTIKTSLPLTTENNLASANAVTSSPIPHEVTSNPPTHTSANLEDYPGVINQGQLFSVIDNGTMFDIIDINETLQETSTTESPTKKTKKPLLPTKHITKITLYKKDSVVKLLTTQAPSTTKKIQSVDELEENLTKEFEMMPDINKDNTVKLNRTFRKELPSHDVLQNGRQTDVNLTVNENGGLENGGQFGVPFILNLTISNNLEGNDNPATYKKTNEESHSELSIKGAIDPRIFVLNNHPNIAENNHSEFITEKAKVSKENFLPKPLLIKSDTQQRAFEVQKSDNYNSSETIDHPFPSDEPKKVNRHRSLHNNNKGRKFYPYFFSRMLG